jgi:hypothetical protein
MPNTNTPPRRAPHEEGGLLKSLVMLALPVLSFHRDILPTIKTSLETHKDEHIKAIGKFLSFELHALMMVLDPARKLRGDTNEDIEKKLTGELTQVLEKLANGMVSVVQIQQDALPPLIDALKKIKDEKSTKAKR